MKISANRILPALLLEAAQKFCADQQAAGVPVFGCPVQYDVNGAVPLAPR